MNGVEITMFFSSLSKIKKAILLSSVLSLMCFTNVTSAYSLADAKAEYPKIKIKTETRLNDAGIEVTENESRLFISNVAPARLRIYAVESGELKLAYALVQYQGGYWYFFNKLTIGDGVKATTFQPKYEPTRNVGGGWVYEYLSFAIDKDNLDVWKNAKIIRMHGERGTSDIPINPEKYNQAMDILSKFLDETK